ncbi:sensor histidine kinase [Alishewanella tabrizica]|uniref:histidine kinase n=1 Tax=Alishewanella tabrizica TaxID=671278 RepID=A0ABQ2WK79_9ALTE|nr:ATP-binding protein [Alishewanella tabrizica]GGW59074.1 hypothetical protein GCM10008111_13930 [Alishewanella tabrizica]
MSITDELSALPCSLIITDAFGKIVFMNALARIEFLPEQVTLPTAIEQLFPPAAKIFLQTHLWPMLRKEGQVREYYLNIKSKLGTSIPILVNVAAGVYSGESCYRWVLLPAYQRASFEQELLNARQQSLQYAQEVSVLKQRLQNILDAAQDIAIMTLDQMGVIQFTNLGAGKLLGYPYNELVGQNIEMLFCNHQETHAGLLRIKYYLNAIYTMPTAMESVLEFESTLAQQSGAIIDVLLQFRPVPGESNASPKQILLLATDISKRKQLERLQNDFVATISHEFRTPLTAILASLTLLSHRYENVLEEKAKRLVDLSVINSQRLKRLVNDLLDLGDITSGNVTINLQSCALEQLIERAVNEQTQASKLKQITLNVLMPEHVPSVCTDPDKFHRVLVNLLSNAIKFSPVNSTVNVQATAYASCVVLRIEDQGCGVKPEFESRLFTQFTQENNASNREYEGSGLGLAICKGLVNAMGGEIGYQSAQPHGAIFWFSCLRG